MTHCPTCGNALASSPETARDHAEKLGRFGHHPDPAIDFCIEVEALDNEVANTKAGFTNGTPSTVELRERAERAMEFRVGGDEGAVAAKATLRKASDTLGDIERAQSSGERAEPAAFLVERLSGGAGYGNPRRIIDAAKYDPRRDEFWFGDAKSKHLVTPLYPLSRPQADDGWRPTHRHVKRGSEYMLLGIGKMQTQGWLQELVLNGHVEARTSVDMREVAIYRGADGSLWARPIEDFSDGRFEALPSAPATGGGE